MIEALKLLIPNFSHFQECEMHDSKGEAIGYQSALITTSTVPFAGGTARDLNTARRICIAEAVERATFLKLIRSETKEQLDELLLKEYPTTCGFAAGFDERKTTFRATCEAIERWAWSQWIDKGFGLMQVQPQLKTELSSKFEKHFDSVHYFRTHIKLSGKQRPSFVGEDFLFNVVIGVKADGIFPGSRVTTVNDESWEHPLLEAWRHHQIFVNELSKGSLNGLFDRRIKRFGEAGLETLSKVLSLERRKFPSPELCMMKRVATGSLDGLNQYQVWRALCREYIGWHLGDENRFVY